MEESETNKYLRNALQNVKAGILVSIGGSDVMSGLEKLAEYHAKINSISNAVYSHADKITPEIIQQANEMTETINLPLMASVHFIIAGVCAIGAYNCLRRLE